MKYLFSTEGHVLPIKREYRRRAWDDGEAEGAWPSTPARNAGRLSLAEPVVLDAAGGNNFTNNVSIISGTVVTQTDQIHESFLLYLFLLQCEKFSVKKSYFLPIEGEYLRQIEALVGLDVS